jgi:3-oxoacyl-[acyl-carrier protein] reductase
MIDFSLENKKALVGGSTQGIGLAIAKTLAEMGASVTLIARNEQKLQETIKNLPSLHQQKHYYIVANYQSPQEVSTQVKKFLEKYQFDTWEILVNNTGGPNAGNILTTDVQNFYDAYAQHLICNQILAQIFIPLMQKANFGRIINIISTSVKEPLENLGVSNTTRWAVAAWAKTLATEIAHTGITVNNVLPGATQTSRIEAILENKAKKMNISLEEAQREMLKTIPMQRFAQPQEIANGVAFLASSLASYITGTNLVIDGGRMKSL